MPICEATARAQDQTEGGDTGKVKVPSREVEPVTGVCTVVPRSRRGPHDGFLRDRIMAAAGLGGALYGARPTTVFRRSLEFSLSVEQYFFVTFSEQDSLGDSFDLLDFKEEELEIVSDLSPLTIFTK